MNVNRWSLNLQQAASYISPFNGRPVNFLRGSALYGAESSAMGGTQFQHHRDIRGSAYVKDALPTENGYISVGVKKVCVENLGGVRNKADFVHGCTGSRESLISYEDDEMTGVVSQVDGSLYHVKGESTLTLIKSVEGACHSTRESKPITGIDLLSDLILGIEKIGIRTLIWTNKELYYNGQEDFYDYKPALRTGAGKLGIAFDIGAIIQVQSFGNGFYVLGTRGGAYAKHCTGDILFPFQFSKIDNFNGISHKDDCLSDFETQSLYVMSHNALQIIEITQATNVFPDESIAFIRGKVASTQWHGMPEAIAVRGAGEGSNSHLLKIPDALEDFDSEEYLDEIVGGCQLPFYFESELADRHEQHVAVNNLDSVYVTVSYGTTTHNVEAVGKNRYQYSRLFVYNKVLKRYTILHVEHTDVIRARHETREPFIIVNKDIAYELVESEGLGEILFSDLIRSTGKASTISQVDLVGDFNTEYYKKHYNQYLQNIPFGTGIDHMNSQYHGSMELGGYGRRELNYSGRVVDTRISFIVPFVGRINEVILNVV